MSKLTKRIATIGVVGVVALSMVGTSASAALTQAQIDAIVTMIQSFGADAATIANVQSALSGGGTVSGGTTGVTACSFTKDLTLGSTGDDVKCLQQYLNAAGYPVASTGVGSAGSESTYFGTLTQSALAKWQAAMSVSPTAGYFGSLSRAKYASVAGTTGTGGTTTVPGVSVPATGLAVSVASGNPVGTTIPKGGTGVTYLKFNIAGTGTVQTIVVKRTGAGATTDFSSVYLYEGGTRLTSGRSVNSSSHEVTFTSLALAVSGVRTFSVVADMSATAAAADNNAFQVTSVTADSGVSVSGLPLAGNEMAISGASAGSVTLTKTGSLANPNIGQLAAHVSQFRITAASENVSVSRISLFSGGTTSKSNLSNFVLKEYATGNTLATATGVNAKDLVVFELATPYQILRGENKSFNVYADIGGGAKRTETIKLYIDETTDVFAIGQQYGQGVTVTRTAFDSDADSHHELTLQGATVTITFNGPNTGDIRKNGKDLSLFDFNLASANNIEIRNLRFTITASTTVNGPDDLKVVDVDSGLTVAGPKDDASGAVVFTDVFNVNAGQSRHLRVTADTDTNYVGTDTLRAQLTAFGASDIKNLDNNQFLTVASEVSPSGTVSGNTLTVKAPTLNVGLSGTPVSDVFIKGTPAVPFLGLSLQAIADDIKVTTIKLTSSGSSSTTPTDKDELTAIKLYDGTTQVGTVKSLTGTADNYNATFDNLTLLIPKGTTKVITAKVDVSSAATAGNAYSLLVADVASATAGVDIIAVDSEGNEPGYQVNGTTTGAAGDSVNGADTVQITVRGGGTMDIAVAPDDSETKAGIILAGSSNVVLAKFNFTANNEALTVKKLRFDMDTNTASDATASELADEITKIYLFEGTTVVGSATGYPFTTTADDNISIEGLAWLVPKDTTKTLTVKADLSTVANGADTGSEAYVNLQKVGFQADGSATSITAFNVATPATNGYVASGKQKVVYKTKPTVSRTDVASSLLNAPTDLEVARFTIAADAKEQIGWAAIGIEMTLLNASFSDVALSVRDITNGLDLTVTTQAPNTTVLDLTADTAKSAILILSAPEQISAGSSRTYAIKISATAAQFGTSGETETLTSRLVLHNDSTTANLANAATFSFGAGARVDATLNSADNAFVWTDFSLSGAEDADADWANGVYIDTFPSTPTWNLTRTN